MKEILAYYAKLATVEGIYWKEAKKIADTFDVEAFQAKAKQLVESKDFSKEANKALKRYNTAMYVSREKLLKQQLHMIVVDSYSKQENVVKRHLEDSIERTMKHQSGILGADVKIKKTDIQAIVNADFKNVTWSKRLWTDQAQLQTEVEKMASNVMTRGRHPKEYVKNIRNIAEPKLNQIKGKVTHNAKRLLITEAARVQSEAQRLHYNETLGEDGEYTFIAKMDEKTSAICKTHNGKVYKVKEMVPGVNTPPLHSHCRSTTAPRPDKDWRKNFFARKKKENLSNKANENKVDQLNIGKKVNITDQAIDKVKVVNIPGHSEEENKTIQLKHKELLKEAKEHNNSDEVVYVMKGEHLSKTYGNNDSVEFLPGNSTTMMLQNSPKQSLVLMHNHPGSSTFSINDIYTFINFSPIKTMTIVTNLGQVKYIVKSKDYNPVNAFAICKKYIGILKDSEITDKTIEKILSELYNLGEINYKVR